MRLTLLLCNLICVCVTRDVRTRVRPLPREIQSADFVTEHFARTKPGTVPRIPASLFQEVSSDQAQSGLENGDERTVTPREEVKYFTAYPSLVTADSNKDIPTTTTRHNIIHSVENISEHQENISEQQETNSEFRDGFSQPEQNSAENSFNSNKENAPETIPISKSLPQETTGTDGLLQLETSTSTVTVAVTTTTSTTTKSFQYSSNKNISLIPSSAGDSSSSHANIKIVELFQQRPASQHHWSNLTNDKNSSNLNPFNQNAPAAQVVSSGASLSDNSGGDNNTAENDLKSPLNDPQVPYSQDITTKNSHSEAKVKLNLDKLKDVGNISRMEAVKTHQNGTGGNIQHLEDSKMPEIVSSGSETPEPSLTGMQDDRNMTAISSPGQSTLRQDDNDYFVNGDLTANGDYFDYSDQHHYHDYYYEYVTTKEEGHLDDYYNGNEHNEETFVEQNVENMSNDSVMMPHPVEINQNGEFTSSTDDPRSVSEEEIDDIHDEDTSEYDTPSREQEQYYDVTTDAELNSHEILIETSTKTDDFEYEEANEEINAIDEHKHRVYYDENNNEDDDNFASTHQQNISGISLMQFTNSHHNDMTSNFGSSPQPDIVRTNINYPAENRDDNLDEVTRDDHADIDYDHNETILSVSSPPSPDVHQDSDIHHPLLTLMQNTPQSLHLLIKPSFHFPDSKVQLMYQQVGVSDPAPSSTRMSNPEIRVVSSSGDQYQVSDLDTGHYVVMTNPVTRLVDMTSPSGDHYLVEDLVSGHYIVCAEVRLGGRSLQSDCFTTTIVESKSSQPSPGMESSIIIVISVAVLIVMALFSYVAFYCVVRNNRLNRERELQRKVEEFARRERDRNEKFNSSDLATTYPDPNEPYEERCIM